MKLNNLKEKFDLSFMKDKRFIFPIFIAIPILFIGYNLINLFSSDQSDQEQSSPKDSIGILSVPIDTEVNPILDRSEAIAQGQQGKEDFTAIRLPQDEFNIDVDSTLYTQDEINYIDSIKREDARQRELRNQELEQQREENERLRSQISNLGNDDTADQSTDDLAKELRLYQKLQNGERIYTEEEKQQIRENQIREEERERIKKELEDKKLLSVSASSSINTAQFNTIGYTAIQKAQTIRAMVDRTVKVKSGSRIRLILLDEITTSNGSTVPPGTYLYAIVSSMSNQRVQCEINDIVYKDNIFPVKLSLYDTDGIPGFYVPKSNFRDLLKSAGASGVSGGNISVNTTPDNFTSMVVQGLSNVYQQASSAVSSKIAEQSATIKYNTIVYLNTKQ